jgi:hypothetical protein
MGENASFQPRSEVVGGLGLSEENWLDPIPTVEQQLSPTARTDFPDHWGRDLPFYSKPLGVFDGSLGLSVGEISSGFSAAFTDLLEPQYFERQNGVSADLTATQGLSPSNHNTHHSSEGRPTKAFRCTKERPGAGRLTFGEDVAMDRVLDFSEHAVVGRSEGKNWAWRTSKVGFTLTGSQSSPRCPISGYSPGGGLHLSFLLQLRWIGHLRRSGALLLPRPSSNIGRPPLMRSVSR